ncbi:MAG: FtsX-like permease family protein [Acidobacteria bacterium]|nr:FtsX-like permease family protein [Acidobacteriota bacterium]
MLRYLPMVLKNSWRNRRRTTLTVLSVGGSMCLLGVLLAVYNALYFRSADPYEAQRLVTRNRVSLVFPMPEFYREKIQRLPGVRQVVIQNWYGGVYKDRRDPKNMFARFATEPERLFEVFGEYRIPEEQRQAFLRERTACVVGMDLVRKHGFKIGDRITLQGDIYPGTLELNVRGIYDTGRNSEVLYFHRKYLEEGLPAGRKGDAGIFTILARSTDDVPRIARMVDEEFRNATVQTRTETEQAFALSFVSFLGNVKVFLLSICAAVTFTIVLVSANTMAMSVRERVREIGVLRTLGFTPGTVLGIILGESAAIALAGGALGCALAAGALSIVRRMPAFLDWTLVGLAPPVIAACLLVALAIGLLSSFVPAWGASRTPIVEALRSTD